MWKRVLLIGLTLTCGLSLAEAQDDTSEVINAGNIHNLQSISRIDFERLQEAGWEVDNGRFVLSKEGNHLAFTDVNNGVRIFELNGTPASAYGVIGQDERPATFLEAVFDPAQNEIASVHADGESYFVARFDFETGDFTQHKFDRRITALWFGDDRIWLELEGEIGYIQADGKLIVDLMATRILSDPESVIRIGRIEPPLAVTVTEDGRVKRWNMETGEVTAEVQVEGGLPIYGALNAGGDRYLVWRDPPSTALHILDFETGEDRTIVPLAGMYIPFVFLNRSADVIIGVNPDDEPVVVAWDIATGTRYNLGTFRECNRPPDMARLSQDGTTLVIGCDTGLDIWRIKE